MRKKQAIIIGAGIGGLATAIRLQASGDFQVTVFEKNRNVGGRADTMSEGGFQFDVGPSLLLMTDVYRDLFAAAGEDFDRWVTMVKLDPNYRVHFGDGSTLEMSSELTTMIRNLEWIEPGVGPRYYRFLEDACRKYRIGRRDFVEKNFTSAGQFFNLKNLGLLTQLDALRSLYSHVSRFFRDHRLRQAFSMQTMYLGISPFQAPAVYTLLPYTELAEDGLYFPLGGTYALPTAMSEVAAKLGVSIQTQTDVQRIVVESGEAKGVKLRSGRTIPADVVISNADLPYTYTNLLEERPAKYAEPRWLKDKFTCSAFNLYLGVDKTYSSLLHHNFFLTSRYKETFEDLFDRHVLPDDPAFYVSCVTRTDASLSPPGCDNIFVLAPVPHITENLKWDDRDVAMFEDRLLDALERKCMPGLRNHIVVKRRMTPRDWQSNYNLKYGAAFGLSHGLTQVGYFRPANKAPHVEHLYFVGASTTPGTGVPLVCLGAKSVAARIMNDYRGKSSGVESPRIESANEL